MLSVPVRCLCMHIKCHEAEILPYAAYEQCVILNTFMRNIVDLYGRAAFIGSRTIHCSILFTRYSLCAFLHYNFEWNSI